MLDFLMISTRSTKKGLIEIYPDFKTYPASKDLMIRGGDFYAIWDEEQGVWSTKEADALRLIDSELKKYYEEKKNDFDCSVKVLYMWKSSSGMIDIWHKYCQRQTRDSFHVLDQKLIFSNDEVKREDYSSKRLTYPLEEGDISAYESLINTLYDEEEKKKIEWAIGSIVTGDSRDIQKFLVLYGAAGTGKSTVLNIIQMLFEGYYGTFDAKALGSSNQVFALEAFKNNPLVAIQHDGDLSKIEDNTRLNSLVSHEEMMINEKFKSTYSTSFKCFLFMGTNNPVKITDAKSGLLRRLIDVTPTGKLLSRKEYKKYYNQIKFELGPIAYHCKQVYLDNKNAYDDYIPVSMMSASNDFYNFIMDSYFTFENEDGISLKAAWEMYKIYSEEANVLYPLSKMKFKEELKNYFWSYEDRYLDKDQNKRFRNYYKGFRTDKLNGIKVYTNEQGSTEQTESWLVFEETDSIFDDIAQSYPAQLANEAGTPMMTWAKNNKTLKDIQTSKLHYVKVPENHIVIDFDIPDESGNKSLEKNIKAASKWPPTYAELSKSGQGIHLHYIYTGDADKLCRLYDEHIEIKVFKGGSSLRRKLTKCTKIAIATISSGLPLVKGAKMIRDKMIKSEQSLRNLIIRNLRKEIHPGTKPSVCFIHDILEDAYNNGVKYDVTDLEHDISLFAMKSTHHPEYCIKLVDDMKFKSEEMPSNYDNTEAPIIFFDVEVFPNLFIICWKKQGPNTQVVKMINPTRQEVEGIMKYRLIGFNCRDYDNHLVYARAYLGYKIEDLYNLSNRIINQKQGKIGQAYNVSYTDIYDFSKKKQSLKKWEIELGIHHQELGLPWDEPVPKSKWELVADYCVNDVIATEEVFNALQPDFIAREVLADVSGMTVNDKTNTLTTRIIFGGEKNPQLEFNYRNMGDISNDDIIPKGFDEYTRFDGKEIDPELRPYGRPIFPGYEYSYGVSTYRGEKVGEGGYVYSEPGVHYNVALLDIASMHPSSVVAETLFGVRFTKRFMEILQTRIYIKHKDFDNAKKMLNGALGKYLEDESMAKDLANALKIAINSVYGLTSAKFDNPFRDRRNTDNIVAKRGALFMVNLKHEVQKRGFTVAHIKTDSIKIPNATPEIIQFVNDYGKMYGYTFEHEATYEKMCLVDKANYIAKYEKADICQKRYGYIPEKNEKSGGEWTVTGDKYANPYVFKTLFTHDDIVFDDMCCTMAVKVGDIYIDKNEGFKDVTEEEKQLTKLSNLLKKSNFKKFTKEQLENSIQELQKVIKENHNYKYVGRVGQFVPMKSGYGAGALYRYDRKIDKNYAVQGSKGYIWLEAETVKNSGKEDGVDRSYFDELADKARMDIEQYTDFNIFRQ